MNFVELVAKGLDPAAICAYLSIEHCKSIDAPTRFVDLLRVYPGEQWRLRGGLRRLAENGVVEQDPIFKVWRIKQ